MPLPSLEPALRHFRALWQLPLRAYLPSQSFCALRGVRLTCRSMGFPTPYLASRPELLESFRRQQQVQAAWPSAIQQAGALPPSRLHVSSTAAATSFYSRAMPVGPSSSCRPAPFAAPALSRSPQPYYYATLAQHASALHSSGHCPATPQVHNLACMLHPQKNTDILSYCPLQ